MSVKTEAKYWGLVPAAGSGRRFGGSIPKQYQPLLDKTVLEHSLDRLLGHQQIAGVMVVISEPDPYWRKLKLNHSKLFQTGGGKTRAESVLNGLQALQQRADLNDWVLVHDAARPCLTRQCLNKLLAVSENNSEGAILALPSIDTVKQSNLDQRITATLVRDQIWLAQTPQMFRLGVLQQALQQGLRDKIALTDEASAIENVGIQPRLVVGSASNIKITRAGDLELASYYLQQIKDYAAE